MIKQRGVVLFGQFCLIKKNAISLISDFGCISYVQAWITHHAFKTRRLFRRKNSANNLNKVLTKPQSN
jgi:hypothetical protein